MEFIFILATVYLITVLPYIQFFKQDYILGLDNKKEALSAASWLATYIFIDFWLLKALPLTTKCSLMIFILTEIDIERNPSSFMRSIKMKSGIEGRMMELGVKAIICFGLILFDIIYIDLHSRSTSTIILYYITLGLLAFNTLYIYAYIIKRTIINRYIDRKNELVKVKWLAYLMLAFYVPIFVFLTNQTPNYRILRFTGKPLTIFLVALGTLLHFYQSIFSPEGDKNNVSMKKDQMSTSIDPSTTALKRVKGGYIILAVCFIAYFVMWVRGWDPERAAWIIEMFN